MIFLAYDGSINGDWVSHYAVRMAANHPSGRLIAVHVQDGTVSAAARAEKLEQIEAECAQTDVVFESRTVARAGNVVDALCGEVPAGSESFLVCGTRVREGRRGLLSGTVSEQLLHRAHCQTLAVRVVHPGLLGQPRNVLVPLAGHPRGLTAALPILTLFASEIDRLRLLTVQEVSRWRFRRLSSQAARQMMLAGYEYLRNVEQQLAEDEAFSEISVDSHAVVSDDPVKEIVIAANRSRSRLIFAGASARNLTERFFYGNPLELLLREAPCDVAVYRGPE
jgi:nucleotide-binding universal stress UspA family protein